MYFSESWEKGLSTHFSTYSPLNPIDCVKEWVIRSYSLTKLTHSSVLSSLFPNGHSEPRRFLALNRKEFKTQVRQIKG